MGFKINGILSVDNILTHVDPLRLFKFYCKNFQAADIKFSSEFRKDPIPSCMISYYNGTYLYKDFGEEGALNIFQYISRKYSLRFNEVLQKINIDFGLQLSHLGEGTSFRPNSRTYKSIEVQNKDVIKYKTIINIKKREYLEHDLIWWNNQSWTKDMLLSAKINPITHFKFTSEKKGIKDFLNKCDDYSYSMDYYWNNDVFRRKLYFPMKEAHRKWLSNVDSTIVQGWDLLPKSGDLCIITSSFKDTGPFWRLMKYPISIAPNNEGTFIPEKVFYKIKRRFKNVVLWYDNDEAGLRMAKKHSQQYDIPFFFNPLGSPKDPTDFWKEEDGRLFNYFFQKMYNQIIY